MADGKVTLVFLHPDEVAAHLKRMMHPYLEQARAILEEAINGMSYEQMANRREAKWCVAEIIEHLSLAFGATAVGMEQRLRTGEIESRRPTMKDRVATLMVIGFEYIPTGRKAPGYTVPSGIPADQALRNMRENFEAMDATITQMEAKYGDRVIGVHPVIGPLNANQWRKFHMVHARHHAKQIAATRASTDQKTMTKAAA